MWGDYRVWAVLSALFAGLTAVLAKVGVKDVNSDLATAIRTVVILVFAWSIALFRSPQSPAAVAPRTWLFLVLSGLA
ncbi:MAG TPA: EamA family transporter, partial [Fimbriimonadaceae bacterium]|nr:EamA family transporter [Fimbriimonadaceae bacterium]